MSDKNSSSPMIKTDIDDQPETIICQDNTETINCQNQHKEFQNSKNIYTFRKTKNLQEEKMSMEGRDFKKMKIQAKIKMQELALRRLKMEEDIEESKYELLEIEESEETESLISNSSETPTIEEKQPQPEPELLTMDKLNRITQKKWRKLKKQKESIKRK